MSPLDALWHLLNAAAPPLVVATLLVALAKGLVWRKALADARWLALWAPSALLGVVGQMGVWLVLGAEGTLMGYALWLGLLSLPLAWRLVR